MAHHRRRRAKVENLGASPYCALTTGTGTLTGVDYVIEGTASLVTDQAGRETVATAFEPVGLTAGQLLP